jgi:tetratricopeptide (TPR) repeat protein
MKRFVLLTLIFVSLGVAPAPALAAEAPPVDRTPYSIGGFHREITTSSPDAQLWFDRGLALTFGFNNEEAIRCFERAAEADPECAMAYWGIAYASGPNINNTVMDEAAVERAHENTEKATAFAAQLAPVEAALVAALGARYALPAPEDRRELDVAWADAMRGVAAAHPDDSDVAAICAEAIMLLRPWNHWTKEGAPAPETEEIVRVLEDALARHPDHPALNHFYIHTMEASPNPALALTAADRLRDRMPGVGHLVHMPSHIDVLLGEYATVIETNQKAIEADRLYVQMAGAVNFYTLYRIHNHHFIVYAAMFEGQRELARTTADELVRQIPPELLEDIPDFVEAFVPTPLHVLVRFGAWEEILAQPEPAADLFTTRAVWHYARALAFATTGRIDEAAAEQEAFARALPAIPESRYLFNNPAGSILRVAEAMVAGELAYRRGLHEEAFEHLREAVRRDDALSYDEPWGWMQPARHSLGALLLEQGRAAEAKTVYLDDLRRHPKNVWALHGLAECHERLGEDAEARLVRESFDTARVRADVDVVASCYCRTDFSKGDSPSPPTTPNVTEAEAD